MKFQRGPKRRLLRNTRTEAKKQRKTLLPLIVLCVIIVVCTRTEVSFAADVDKSLGDLSREGDDDDDTGANLNDEKPTTGFVVLGMHRSGTSMLSGLLVKGFGYKVGKPLMQPADDNKRGFFELLTAKNQNEEFLREQNKSWERGVGHYDAGRAHRAFQTKKINVKPGLRALEVLNNSTNVPWLNKDPRTCITLRTWLPLLNSKPAVLFTYRHPVEVAMSLAKRNHLPVWKGLTLWIQYNQAAIQNSFDLCIVRTNNKAVLADPLEETTRVAKELTTKCGVPAPPSEITQEIVNQFVDQKMHHNKRKSERKILQTPNTGHCRGKECYKNYVWQQAMKIYDDLESGEAYKKNYIWPDLLL